MLTWRNNLYLLVMVLCSIFHSDIDECIHGLDGCNHNCTNTVGSYFCTCMDGYELESNNHTCTGDGWISLNCKFLYIRS